MLNEELNCVEAQETICNRDPATYWDTTLGGCFTAADGCEGHDGFIWTGSVCTKDCAGEPNPVPELADEPCEIGSYKHYAPANGTYPLGAYDCYSFNWGYSGEAQCAPSNDAIVLAELGEGTETDGNSAGTFMGGFAAGAVTAVAAAIFGVRKSSKDKPTSQVNESLI